MGLIGRDEAIDVATDVIAECHVRPEGVSPSQIAKEVIEAIWDVQTDNHRGAVSALEQIEYATRPATYTSAGAKREAHRLATDALAAMRGR